MSDYTQHCRLYKDGNMWCAVAWHFRDLGQDDAGFGETQEEAVADLQSRCKDRLKLEYFMVGGFCRRCKDWVQEDTSPEWCADHDCPCLIKTN